MLALAFWGVHFFRHCHTHITELLWNDSQVTISSMIYMLLLIAKTTRGLVALSSVDPAKIEAVTQWQSPTTGKEVRSFLGLAGYYRNSWKDSLALPDQWLSSSRRTRSSSGRQNAKKASENSRRDWPPPQFWQHLIFTRSLWYIVMPLEPDWEAFWCKKDES